MKIDVTEDGVIRMKDVFNSVIFETEEGEELVVCMRDGHFEIAVRDATSKSKSKWYSWYTASSAGITKAELITPRKDVDEQRCSDVEGHILR